MSVSRSHIGRMTSQSARCTVGLENQGSIQVYKNSNVFVRVEVSLELNMSGLILVCFILPVTHSSR